MKAQLKKVSIFKILQSKRKNGLGVWNKIIPILVILLHRLWWHTKGYGTVVGMMGLVLVSMLYLYLRSLSAKFFKYHLQDEWKKSV
jgi:hypothetical protein